MLLNFLQRTGQRPQERIIWPRMSVVLRPRNPDLSLSHCMDETEVQSS